MASAGTGMELPFEEALAGLEEVVQRLEEGDLPLQEVLALYERGMALAGHCQALLDQAELRVTQLAGEGEEVREVPFEETTDDRP
jgi:exodeoxyribonuclease VII small subunit